MIFRYDLDVSIGSNIIYSGLFSSINQMVKFACGFSDSCDLDAYDMAFDKRIPIDGLVQEFKNNCSGI